MTKTYELKGELSYHYEGQPTEAKFIEMRAPSRKNMEHFVAIKKSFAHAIDEIEKPEGVAPEKSDQDAEISGKEVMQLMYISKTVDMNKVNLHCEQLFKSGCALVDGSQTLTTPIFDSMSIDDAEGLIGDYIAAFITPSLIGG